jgi:hypothetical protein
MPSSYTESDRRLRAAVRVVMSPGIWFVLGVQFLILMFFHIRLPAELSTALPLIRVFGLSVLVVAFFYLMTGVSLALTRDREAIGISQTIRCAKEVFARFMWLLIKAGLLFVLFLNIVTSVALTVTGLEPQVMAERYFPMLMLFAGGLGFIFVFWRPVVFVKQDFQLLSSLIAALRILWGRLTHSAYLAILTLTPTLVTLLLPEGIPLAVVVGLNLMDGLMGWVAYVYCVEWLQADLKRTPVV